MNGIDLHSEAARRLAVVGHRVTPARRVLLDALRSARAPLTAAEVVDSQLAPVSDVLFTAAGLRAGERVLDVGCGLGSTTRRAAGIVGSPTPRTPRRDAVVVVATNDGAYTRVARES